MTRDARCLLGFVLIAASGGTLGCGDSTTSSPLECGTGTIRDGDRCVPAVGGRSAAGGGSSSTITCGQGTVLVANTCVIAAGGAAGSAGRGGADPSVSNAGSAATLTTAGAPTAGGAYGSGGVSIGSGGGGASAAGGNIAAAGSAGLGATSPTGTSGTGTTAGSSGTSSAGGTRSTGGTTNAAGSGGMPSTGGVPGTSGTTGNAGSSGVTGTGGSTSNVVKGKWFALSYKTTSALYDVSQLPSGPALPFPMGTGIASWLSPWSPDGSMALLSEASGTAIIDVSDVGLGSTRHLGTVMPPPTWADPRKSAWSGDSTSLAVQNADFSVFGVINPRVDLPVLHQLGNVVSASGWAPIGSKLFYTDASGAYVVDVVAGVPKTPMTIVAAPASSWAWNADGNQLALCAQGQLYYAKLSSTGATIKQLTLPKVESPTCALVGFNALGNRLAFVGSQQRAEEDLHVVFIDALGPGPLQVVTLPTRTSSIQSKWSNTGDFLAAGSSAASMQYVIDLSGSAPGIPVEAPMPLGPSKITWAPKSPVFVTAPTTTSLAVFDCAAPTAGLRTIVSGTAVVRSLAFAPNSTVLAYTFAKTIKLVDVRDLTGPITTHTMPDFMDDVVDIDSWSPDASLLALTTRCTGCTPNRFSLYLVRAQGVATSAPVSPWGGIADYPPTLAWQP